MKNSDIKDIVIVGYGGFAKEVKWIIDNINAKKYKWNFLGYIDANIKEENIDVIGTDEFLLKYNKKINVVIAIGDVKLRKKIYTKLMKNEFLEFPTLIDPTVLLSDSVKIGKGNILCALNVLTVEIEIGDFNIVNLNCTIGHNSKINNFTTINPGTNISGDVIIEDEVEIGTGCKLIQGISVGSNSIIGAGTVVIRNLKGNCTAVGVPAKIIKEVEYNE